MIHLTICDKENAEYGTALVKAISGLHNEFEMELNHFCDLSKFRIDYEHDFNLFLMDGYTSEELEEWLNEKPFKSRIVILSEFHCSPVDQQLNQESSCWQLYKYAKVSNMIRDLYFIHGILTGKKTAYSFLKTQMIGFFSISGGVGKTALAISFSRELARYRDKKVLYLSFEEMPATELFFGIPQNPRNIGDYLYYLLQRQDENLWSHLDGFVVRDEYGVETFCSSAGRNDLRYLSKEELAYLINVLYDCCRYDYIICDFNNDLSDETLKMIDQCSKTVMIQSDNPVSEYKTNKLNAFFKKQDSMRFPDDFVYVMNRSRPNVQRSYQKHRTAAMPMTIYCENDCDSFCLSGEHLEVSINHDYGIGIKKLADHILSIE